MAEEGGSEGRYHPAIITFRPDNFLTVGLIFVIVYLAGALGVQLLGRVGVLKLAGAPAGAASNQPAPGTVATP